MKPGKFRMLSSLVFHPVDIRFQNQNSQENLLLFIRQHRIILIPPIFWTIVLSLLPPIIGAASAFLKTYGYDIGFGIPGGIWLALTVLWYFWIFAYLFQQFVSWFFNAYVMTNERLIDFDFDGLLSHGADETNIANIETAESAIGGLWGTIFNMGTITIRTAADRNNFRLDNVPNPNQVRDFIMDYVVAMDKPK